MVLIPKNKLLLLLYKKKHSTVMGSGYFKQSIQSNAPTNKATPEIKLLKLVPSIAHIIHAVSVVFVIQWSCNFDALFSQIRISIARPLRFAIRAVARKLARACWMILKHQQPYAARLKFPG